MKKTRTILALVMVIALMATALMPSIAISNTTADRAKGSTRTLGEQNDETSAQSHEARLHKDNASRFIDLTLDAEEQVTAIVILEDDAAVRATTDVNSQEAQAIRARLLDKQETFLDSLNFDAELNFNYTVLLNGVSITTAFGNLETLEQMKGVKAVYIANQYSIPETTPQMEYANEMTGAAAMQTLGFDGDGILVAVLDTGLNTTHEAFEVYGNIDNPALESADLADIDTNGSGAYLSEKVPFAYDYADDDNDVTDHDGHGTHVSGTAVGYVEAEDGAITFSGAAPAAQLLSMKIFADEEGFTDSGIYFAALEDALLLGADVVNMSIGSPGGFTYDSELEDEVFGNIYQTLEEAGVILNVSAGNEYSMAYANLSFAGLYYGVEMIPAWYTDYGTVGSPSTYEGNLSIASIENVAYPQHTITVGEEMIGYTDSSYDQSFIATFAGQELDYVMVPNLGAAEDYNGIDVTGKVAVVSRGDLTFSEKLENAYNAGAIAMICYNNTAGNMGMSIEYYSMPAVFVTQAAGAILAEGNGKLTVDSEMTNMDSDTAYLMSEFSGWGVTSDLKLKPQLTAPGGYIYSSVNTGDSAYDVYSGTSMAAPNSTGTFAAMLQAIRAEYTDLSKAEQAALIENRVLSTATLIVDADGNLYSPRKQGTGLINATGAIDSPIYIDQPIVELYDDPEKAGVYTFDVEIVNDSEEDLDYTVDSHILTDLAEELGEDGTYNALTSRELDSAVELRAMVNLYMLGDANLDSEVDSADAAEILRHTVQLITLSEEAEYKGDVTQDGNTNSADAAEILRYVVELVAELPMHTEEGVVEGNVITIPANDSLSLKVKITLSDADKTYLAGFENGAFVEGFICLTSEEEGVADVHSTFMGYYGNWLDGQILETYDFRDVAPLEAELVLTIDDETGLSYADLGYTADMFIEMIAGYNEGWAYSSIYEFADHLGANPMDYIEGYNEDCIAISNENSTSLYYWDMILTYPMQLRNAAHLIMMVSDSETGEIYYVDDTPNLPKAAYSEYGYYEASGYFEWDGTDAEGNYLESGTTVDVEYYAWLDYDAEAQDKYEALNGDYSQLSADYLVWDFAVMVDTTSPTVTVKSWDPDSGELVIEAADENYLAYVGVSTEDWDEIEGYVYADETRGTSQEVTFDLSEVLDETVYVSAMDYATNWPDWTFNLTTGDLTLNELVPPVEYDTINSVRHDIEDGILGETYTVEGCVTLIDGRNVYIQTPDYDYSDYDDYYGICLYFAEAPTEIYEGDVIVATGQSATHRGLPELTNVTLDDITYMNEGYWDYYWPWNYVSVAELTEYMDTLICTPIGYGMDADGNDDVSLGLTIVSVTPNGTGYYNMVLTDGTNEVTLYKCVTPADGIDAFQPGAVIGGYLVVGCFDTVQLRCSIPEDIWVLQEATTDPTPSEPPTTEGLPYFTNALTSNGVTIYAGQTTETLLSSGEANPIEITADTDHLAATPFHGVGSFSAENYSYVYFTADLTDYSGLKLTGTLNGNGRVPTQFAAEYAIGEGEYVSLGNIAIEHEAGTAPAEDAVFSFDVPAACDGQSAVTFRLRQATSSTSNAAGSSTSDSGSLKIYGFGLTDEETTDPTPVEPTPV
ncbi:MAG: S8 family serine peptidase, partial [Clostridia bacterium]|nr:S8 family serine peptidase [Clostridia bacterium]